MSPPAGFDMCRQKGGKIRTVKPTADTYQPVCYLGKKSFRGYTHKVESKGSATADAIKSRSK